MDDLRVMIFDQTGAPLYDLTPDQIFGLQRTEAINGEHKLVITTAQVLAQGQRVLMRDGMLKWREYVITGGDQAHQNGARPIGTYQAVWSLQYDLSGVTCDKQPGIRTGATAREALVAALSGTKRWAVGTVTVGTTAGASMWQRSAWEALSVLVENWGGEIDATITVGSTGVTSRAVDLLDSVGKSSATRRFEYGVDLVSINRKVIEGVQYCRIIPLGAGYADGIDSSDSRRRVTIEELTPGHVEWLQNDAVAPYVRVPDGTGGYEYPTKFVIYESAKTPQELLDVAQRDLLKYTTPQVTYTASVFQYAEAGIDVSGVALGDPVQVVDSAFYDGLRLEARVTKLVVDELNPASTTVTIGNISDTIASAFTKIGTQVNALSNEIIDTNATMADYINNILDEVNAKVNATGGYTYLVPGRGMVTYDVPITDLTDDSAAHQVTEIRGGTLRFANSRDSSGNWQYKTVILSGYINTDLIQAQSIEASKISTSLMEIITEWGDYIYTVQGGLLVTQPGSNSGLLVNSAGSTDVVRVTWTGDTPSVSSTINRFGRIVTLGDMLLNIVPENTTNHNNVRTYVEKLKKDSGGAEIEDQGTDHPQSILEQNASAVDDEYFQSSFYAYAEADDTSGEAFVDCSSIHDPDGYHLSSSVGVTKNNTEYGLRILKYPDDANVYANFYVDDYVFLNPAKARTALGIQKVAYTNYTDFFSPTNGVISVTSGVLERYGDVMSLSIIFTTETDISVTASGDITNLTIGGLASGFRPSLRTGGYSGSNGRLASYYIGATGTIQLAALASTGAAYTLPAGTTLEVCATYVCAS